MNARFRAVHLKYDHLFVGTERFTAMTRTCLERAVARALLFHQDDGSPLRDAVRHATCELVLQGLDGPAILALLVSIVEGAGRASRADRASLLSGQPLWTRVRDRVVELATSELAGLECDASTIAVRDGITLPPAVRLPANALPPALSGAPLSRR